MCVLSYLIMLVHFVKLNRSHKITCTLLGYVIESSNRQKALATIPMLCIIYIYMAYRYIVQNCRFRTLLPGEYMLNVLSVYMFSLISDLASIL